MIQELFLYDKEKGLFKEILKQSTIIKGSYHVSPNQGNDLNTSNLETYIKDPASGLTDLKNYPICVCMTPRSRFININGQRWEAITFNLYFLTTTFRTSDNKIKNRDTDTNTSKHHVWFDWQDMKNCAVNFIDALHEIRTKRKITINNSDMPLGAVMDFKPAEAIFNRLTKFNNDQLTGVSVAFTVMLLSLVCEDNEEYNALDTVTMPPLIIHSANDD